MRNEPGTGLSVSHTKNDDTKSGMIFVVWLSTIRRMMMRGRAMPTTTLLRLVLGEVGAEGVRDSVSTSREVIESLPICGSPIFI